MTVPVICRWGKDGGSEVSMDEVAIAIDAASVTGTNATFLFGRLGLVHRALGIRFRRRHETSTEHRMHRKQDNFED